MFGLKRYELIIVYLKSTMTGNDEEWIGYCKYHPDIDHFYISGYRQWLWYSHETKNVYIFLQNNQRVKQLAYKVIRTKSRVVLTSMTISKKVPLKVVVIWLIRSNIPVGRNIVIKCPVSGLLKLKSTKIPSLPYLSTLQNLRSLNWYLPKS